MKPTFENVALRIEKPKKDLFEDKGAERKFEATLIEYGKDCDHDDIVRNLNKKVCFNGRVSVTIEETEDYTIVLTHQENVLAAL